MLLNLDNIPHFHKNYIKQIEETDLLQALRISSHRMLELIHFIKEEKSDYRYAEDKWTVREVLCHMLDTERIMAYRALTFARNDKTHLPPFEEKDYGPQANASGRSLKKIADEFGRLRASTIDLFESFTPEMLNRKGTANNNQLSVVALGFIIAGHETHHRKILMERYLSTKE
jgi:uncharacterized damage-inducible protein DinB